MPFDSTLWSVLFWILGLTVGLGLRVMIFQASWALTGMDDPPFRRVLMAVTPLWIVAFVGGVLLDSYLFKPTGSPTGFGVPRILGLLGIIAATSVIDLAVYLPVLRPGASGGAYLALFETILTVLAAVLIAAIIFVVVAVTQVATRADAGPLLPNSVAYTCSVGWHRG